MARAIPPTPWKTHFIGGNIGCCPLFREQVPGGEEHCGDYRPDDQPVDAEYRNAAKRGDQHEIIRNFRFAPHQNRAQDIVDSADDERPERDQDDPLPDGSGEQQIEAYGEPDQAGADSRQQRQHCHHGPPQQRSLDAEQPEDQSAQRALHDRDNDAALDGRADHGGEAPEQRVLLCVSSGAASRMRLASASPSRSRKNSKYSMTKELTTRPTVFCPIASACAAIN